MSYYISVPYKSEKYGTKVYSNGKFEAYEWNTRIDMFMNDLLIGSMHAGRNTLDGKFKGKFENWIEFLKNKDLDKVSHTRELIKEAEESCKFIESLWE